jgi:hypothetical protein
MSQNPARYAAESLGALIFTIRGQRVMLDADLASILWRSDQAIE